MAQASSALALSDRAEAQSRALPPLLVEAQRIAATVILGDHGRKRAGPGESFWQYRPYSFGDSTQRIDWHKSARSDRVFIRENEWEAANTLWLWSSPHVSMSFQSNLSPVSKQDRADLIALAAGALALRAHERVGAIGAPHAPDHGRTALIKIAEWFHQHEGAALPRFVRMPRYSSALLVSDFFETVKSIATAVSPMAQAGVKGHLVQVVDPAEESLPYAGRVEFQDMAGPLKFLSSKTEALRPAYAGKLARHRDELRDMCTSIGWTFTVHRTDASAARLLMQLHHVISGNWAR